uniref:Transient receptor potential cation channel subfamily A member 1 n=1 Tax=Panagrolaimus sp. ES5 TaxID=591445 RepID=A0AC34GLT2_9BILA
MVKLLLEELRDDEDENRKVFPLHDAVEKRQLKVLKSIIKRGYAVVDQVNESNQTCLELAIETNFVEGVSFLLSMKHWERAFRRRFKPSTELDPHPQSPMQMLIIKMPQMAKAVFDKCVIHMGKQTHHNYELLDDVYYVPDLDMEDCKADMCELNPKIRS